MSEDESERTPEAQRRAGAGRRPLDPLALLRGALEPGDTDGERRAADLARAKHEIEHRLPDLEVLELLGEGGMGTVWRVRQRRLDRLAALKVLRPRAEDMGPLAERFEREARTLARLAHPNIVAVHDYGREDEFCWLLMECVEGTTLRAVLDGGGLTPQQALALVRDLCDALQFAHERGVVHRDVKPENVLIDRAGVPKVADFGLAKLLGEPAALVSLTATRQVLGTLRYMAPEQLDRPQEVDHRADLYALGVVLYEMLCGEVPQGRFALPSEKAHTDPRLDAVVLRSLEREPARRYQSASEVREDVEALDRAVEGPAPSVTERRLAPGAVLGPALALLGPALFFAALVFLAPTSGAPGRGGTAPMPERATYGFAVGPLLMVLTQPVLMGAASVVGFLTLRRLRQAWSREWGLGGALFAAWLLPYLVGYGLTLGLFRLVWDIVGTVPGWVDGLIAAQCPLGFVGLLIWRWNVERGRLG